MIITLLLLGEIPVSPSRERLQHHPGRDQVSDRSTMSLKAHLPLVLENSRLIGGSRVQTCHWPSRLRRLNRSRSRQGESLPQDKAEQTRATSRYPNSLSCKSLTDFLLCSNTSTLRADVPGLLTSCISRRTPWTANDLFSLSPLLGSRSLSAAASTAWSLG